MVNLKRLLQSFKCAFRGLGSVVKKEQNFRVHIIAALLAIFFGIYFEIKLWQWSLIILMVAAVFILELVNTAFERLADMLEPKIHDYVREIKDIMSAIVLIASLTSLIIALLVFLPYF
ncbi:diacylglycerol kinase family protein [Candidatus Falkowbacteria bacterium]|nr:diacylglycerol kinase family protein [Candidatus Falkowbacteria bacterium]